MRNAIILRYCEIHLKGKNRGYFEKMLKENVKKSLKGIKHTFNVMHSRYLIEDFDDCDYSLITSKIEKIAGIHTYSKSIVVNNVLEEIVDACLLLCADKSGTFKVETNRADKTFEPNSVKTSAYIGGKLLESNSKLKVDVKEPNFTVYVDIREDGKTFVYTELVHALSGMPVGSRCG